MNAETALEGGWGCFGVNEGRDKQIEFANTYTLGKNNRASAVESVSTEVGHGGR